MQHLGCDQSNHSFLSCLIQVVSATRIEQPPLSRGSSSCCWRLEGQRIDTDCHADLIVRFLQIQTMKVTVELSDSEMSEILDLTGERKKGPAIRRLMEEALQLRRRARIAQKFLNGEWGVELDTYEADQERERRRAQELSS